MRKECKNCKWWSYGFTIGMFCCKYRFKKKDDFLEMFLGGSCYGKYYKRKWWKVWA